MSDEILTNQGKYNYLDVTHKYNDFNEISSLNIYLQDVNQKEFNKINNINDNIKNSIYKYKQDYITNDYNINEYSFRINVLIYSSIFIFTILALLCSYVKGKINLVILSIVSVILLIIYLIVIIIVIKYNVTRRNNSYNQFYFTPYVKEKTDKNLSK